LSVAIVNSINFTAVTYPYDIATGEYDVRFHAKGSYAYGGITILPTTILFEHNGVKYDTIETKASWYSIIRLSWS